MREISKRYQYRGHDLKMCQDFDWDSTLSIA